MGGLVGMDIHPRCEGGGEGFPFSCKGGRGGHGWIEREERGLDEAVGAARDGDRHNLPGSGRGAGRDAGVTRHEEGCDGDGWDADAERPRTELSSDLARDRVLHRLSCSIRGLIPPPSSPSSSWLSSFASSSRSPLSSRPARRSHPPPDCLLDVRF